MLDPFDAAIWGLMLLTLVVFSILAYLIKFIIAIIKYLYKVFKH